MTAHKLAQLSNVEISPDGKKITFRVGTVGGKSLDIELDKPTSQKLIQDLTKFAADAARLRTKGKPVPMEVQAPTTFSMLSATQVGVGMAHDRKSMFLILRLFDFDLPYQVTHQEIRSMAKSFVEMAKALDAPEDKPQ